MRNITWILLGLIFSVNLSAQANRRIIQLSGTISEKYPVKMTLTFNGESVLGFYFYEKYNSRILLEGNIRGDSIFLRESPGYEPDFRTGFAGCLKGDSFSGVWIDKDKNKTLKFRATTDSDTMAAIPAEITGIEGNYENIHSSDKFFSSVELKHIVDDLFCFEISNGTESGCVGYLKGLVTLTGLNKGVYSGDLCEKIEFVLLANELTINEDNCDFHGMRCPFDGEYKK